MPPSAKLPATVAAVTSAKTTPKPLPLLGTLTMPPSPLADPHFQSSWQTHVLPNLPDAEIRNGWVTCSKKHGPFSLLTARQLYPVGWRYDIPLRHQGGTHTTVARNASSVSTTVIPGTPSANDFAFDWARFHWVEGIPTFGDSASAVQRVGLPLESAHLAPPLGLFEPITTQPLTVHTVSQAVNPLVDFATFPTWDSYWASRSSNTRSRIKQRTHRAEALGMMVQTVTTQGVEDALTLLLDWHGQKWRNAPNGGPYLFDYPEELACFRAWVDALVAENRLLITGIWLNNTLSALALAVILPATTEHQKPTAYFMLTATSGDYTQCSPGSLCLRELVQWCHLQGIGMVDLGMGDTQIKQSLATHVVSCASGWAMPRFSVLGQLAWWQFQRQFGG